MICSFDFERFSIESQFPFLKTHTVVFQTDRHLSKQEDDKYFTIKELRYIHVGTANELFFTMKASQIALVDV